MSAPSPDDGEGAHRIAFEDLADALAGIVERHGCSPSVARILAANCAAAERDAAHSHGLYRLPGYLSTLTSGWVDGRAVPVVDDVASGFIRVDARNGFAQPALAAAAPLLIEKARAGGIAIAAIRHSHHFGALSLDVEPLAEVGLVALTVVNSDRAVVPYGAGRPVYGTNPIAFAAPRAHGPPLVFDLATSVMAKGEVELAAREGRSLPPDAGVDAAGRPTTDPAAVVAGGALRTFGGHKGSAIAMMVEILCAALVGGKFSFETDPPRDRGALTPDTGQTVIAIDPARGSTPRAALPFRVEDLVAELRDAGQNRLPGQRRLEARARHAQSGIPVSPETVALLDHLRAARPGR